MKTVLAAIDNSPAARSVLAAALALCDLFDAEVEAVHAREDGDRTARAAAAAAGVPLRLTATPGAEGLLEAARADDVVAVALGVRSTALGPRPAGHVALRLAVSVAKPLIVVPPDARLPLRVRRILVPLNGDGVTAAALAETIRLAGDRELAIVVLHVHELADLPLFTDQPQHELNAWTQEFLRRHRIEPGRADVEIRVGVPGQHVVDVAASSDVDLIVLGWTQHLASGRAAVVREVLERAPVPVLLVPLAKRAERDGGAASSPALSGASL